MAKKKPNQFCKTLKDQFNRSKKAVTEFGREIKSLKLKDIPEITKDTIRDMDVKEAVKLGLSVVLLPGGIVAYPLYRMHKYKEKHKTSPKPPPNP